MTIEPVTRIEMYYAIESAFASPPVTTEELSRAAHAHSARAELLTALAGLPAGHVFPRLRDVWEFYPDMATGAVGDL